MRFAIIAMALVLAGCGDSDERPDLPKDALAFMDQCRNDNLDITYHHRYTGGGWGVYVECSRHKGFGTLEGK